MGGEVAPVNALAEGLGNTAVGPEQWTGGRAIAYLSRDGLQVAAPKKAQELAV